MNKRDLFSRHRACFATGQNSLRFVSVFLQCPVAIDINEPGRLRMQFRELADLVCDGYRVLTLLLGLRLIRHPVRARRAWISAIGSSTYVLF